MFLKCFAPHLEIVYYNFFIAIVLPTFFYIRRKMTQCSHCLLLKLYHNTQPYPNSPLSKLIHTKNGDERQNSDVTIKSCRIEDMVWLLPFNSTCMCYLSLQITISFLTEQLLCHRQQIVKNRNIHNMHCREKQFVHGETHQKYFLDEDFMYQYSKKTCACCESW